MELRSYDKFWAFFVDFDECASSPCQNMGTCFDAIDGYTCICMAGYNGDSCEKSKNFGWLFSFLNEILIILKLDVEECASMPCLNNGTCVDEINRFTCNCTSGYTGAVCETSRIVFKSKIDCWSFLSA